MRRKIYDWLVKKRNTTEDALESRLFAMMLAYRSTSDYWTIESMLGLTDMEMDSLMIKYFPLAMKGHKEPVISG